MTRRGWMFTQKKILAFFAVTGCCGGFFIAFIDRKVPGSTVSGSFFQFAVLLICGIIIGIAAEKTYKSNKNIFLKKETDNSFVFFRQRLFLLFILIAIASWFFNIESDIGLRLVLMSMASIVFIVGLSCGIYDQFSPDAGRMLLAGMVPLSVSIIFLFVDISTQIKTVLWTFGLLYLLCSFLIMNTVHLNKKVFLAQDINLKNVRRIRIYNYILSCSLFLICTGFIFFKRVLLLAGNIINSVLSAVYNILVKFSEAITYDYWYRGVGDPQPDTPREWGSSSVPFDIVRILLVVTVIVIITVSVVLVYKIIRKKAGRRAARYIPVREAEYIEENEIAKTQLKFEKKKKYRYTMEGLLILSETNDRIRYLYGFILERLYCKKIKLNESDTPMEIHEKILAAVNGEQLDQIGFDELTDIYRKVRYGNKQVAYEINLPDTVMSYENIIAVIGPEQDNTI